MKQIFTITGMTCSACSAHVERGVTAVAGVESVSVSLLQNSMAVEYDETILGENDIIKAVENAGYGASVTGKAAVESVSNDSHGGEEAMLKQRLIWSVFFLVPLMYISMGHMLGLPLPQFFHGAENAAIFALTQLLLTLPVVFINRAFFITGFKALLRLAPTMDSLIAVGSSAALIYGLIVLYQIVYNAGHGDSTAAGMLAMELYFESAATILTLITVGKTLEARSKGKTTSAIAALMDLSPQTATVLRDAQEIEVPIAEVMTGDTVIVRPGAKIPVDGIITEGISAVDESALTGESIPADKGPGDTVLGGTINKSGYFRFKASRVGEDTALAQIIALVRDANSTKAPITRLADKVSGIFVPTVIIIAVITSAIWLITGETPGFALSMGIAVLVISCPCALGLAAPTAIMVGTGEAAKRGILFKTAESLETLHKIKAFALDKTGTLTNGRPEVTDIIPLTDGLAKDELLTLAAAVEELSEHPLARAIVEKAKQTGLTIPRASNFTAEAGRGVSADVDGRLISGGNMKMAGETLGSVSESAAAFAEKLAGEGKTPLLFIRDKQLLGIIALADTVRETSAAAIAGFNSRGTQTVMLTGDNEKTAAAVASAVGISRVISGILPGGKEKEINLLKQSAGRVSMIGDGINDAPALARADVGIAIGAGADIAIDSADVVLMRGDLRDAVTAFDLSHAVIRNIKQNLFWAFFYNTAGIPLAAGVFYGVWGLKLDPMMAAAAMSLSSVCVVTNALRLRFFKPKNLTGIPIRPNANNNKKETKIMTKVMTIEGMSCEHCKARVEKVLCAIPGVTAVVDLEAKTAAITTEVDIPDAVLEAAVTDAGYEVVGIK